MLGSQFVAGRRVSSHKRSRNFAPKDSASVENVFGKMMGQEQQTAAAPLVSQFTPRVHARTQRHPHVEKRTVESRHFLQQPRPGF